MFSLVLTFDRFKVQTLAHFSNHILIPSRTITTYRSNKNSLAKTPVPGCSTLAANLLAKTWNQSCELQNASNLCAAKSAARKWAQSLHFNT